MPSPAWRCFSLSSRPTRHGRQPRLYTKAAEAGRTEGQFRLATLLESDIDPPDPDEARIWLTRAAEAGHSQAQFQLGLQAQMSFMWRSPVGTSRGSRIARLVHESGRGWE